MRRRVSEANVTEGKTNGREADQESVVRRLARFFPDASPVRIPVTVSRNATRQVEAEATVIEFGTAREALFACQLPVEFADKIRLQSLDGSLQVDAWVVAVQYHRGEAAVAARFVQELPHWVVKS